MCQTIYVGSVDLDHLCLENRSRTRRSQSGGTQNGSTGTSINTQVLSSSLNSYTVRSFASEIKFRLLVRHVYRQHGQPSLTFFFSSTIFLVKATKCGGSTTPSGRETTHRVRKYSETLFPQIPEIFWTSDASQ